MRKVTVLIPTFNRVTSLAITLTSLCAQTYKDFDVVISDQTDSSPTYLHASVQSVIRVLQSHGSQVTLHHHLPRHGIAEQRQFLFDQVKTEYCIFIDDDLILEPYVIQLLLETIQKEQCAFVGTATIGLSYLNDIRQNQQQIEFWQGKVEPEKVRPHTSKWERAKLHNAANLYHVQQKYNCTPSSPKVYKISWAGACVIYNTDQLRSIGAFTFWEKLPPEHVGEDVLPQLKLMDTYGGCGVLPCGVYHQEVPTTLSERRVDAPLAIMEE
jgi:glycosyltransferase involved in cell wall biosynthesis